MFFLQREISEMRGPTGVKFCTMVSTRHYFIMNRGRSRICPILNILIRSLDIRRRSLKSYEVRPNFHVFGFFGRTPEILDKDYEVKYTSDHVTKFRGDRPTELGDLLAKQK